MRIEYLKLKTLKLECTRKVTKIPEVPQVTDFYRQLQVIRKWQNPKSDVRGGGVFLPNDLLILTDLSSKQYAVFSNEGSLQRESPSQDALWGMHYDQKMEVIYVTLPEKQEIKMINSHNFAEIKTFPIKFSATGTTSVNGKFFGIETNLLYTLNSDFEVINKTSVTGDSDDITSDVSGILLLREKYCNKEKQS